MVPTVTLGGLEIYRLMIKFYSQRGAMVAARTSWSLGLVTIASLETCVGLDL